MIAGLGAGDANSHGAAAGRHHPAPRLTIVPASSGNRIFRQRGHSGPFRAQQQQEDSASAASGSSQQEQQPP